MKYLKDLDLKNKKVLIRVDYNVPFENNQVLDDFRIRSSLPTLKHCLNQGASVVLMSHLGRPNGKRDLNFSLDEVSFVLEELIEREVMFSNDCISEDAINLSNQMKPGEIHLLENLRFHNGEINNDPTFSWYLSRHGEVYINDAFGTAHRSHASNIGVLKYIDNYAAGLLVEKEIKFLYNTLNKHIEPSILVIGGSKISDKIQLIDNMIDKVNIILIGGAMAFAFLKNEGFNIGGYKLNQSDILEVKKIKAKADKSNVKMYFPIDIVAAKKVTSHDIKVISLDKLKRDEFGFDIGPETTFNYEMIINKSKTIYWNGPLGVSEIPIFSTGTQAIAAAIRRSTKNGAISIIGGGDTASSLNLNDDNSSYTHVSTGGGASLQVLSGCKLPALEALHS